MGWALDKLDGCSFFYSQTLHYCLSHEKLDIGWPKMIERCYDYFDKNEVGNIIPYWK